MRKVFFRYRERASSLTPLSKNIVTASSGPSRFRLGSNSDPLGVLFPTPSAAAGKSTGFTQRGLPKLLNSRPSRRVGTRRGKEKRKKKRKKRDPAKLSQVCPRRTDADGEAIIDSAASTLRCLWLKYSQQWQKLVAKFRRVKSDSLVWPCASEKKQKIACEEN